MNRALVLTLLLTGAALAGGGGAPMSGMDHSVQGMAQMSMAADMQAMGERMTAELQPLSGRAFDIRFAQLMADHHQMAVDMARVEVAGGTDPRVKAAAQTIITAQQREIAVMQGWLRAWTGQEYAPRGMGKLMEIMGSTDRWFLTGMIPHHRGAVEMARLAPTHTADAQVRALAADIVRTQTTEIARFTAWLAARP
ncbi:uncharacterized protein (DUF305 family) [Deinococcus metalli]|uniref:Uncharacterized protein (DUF305 family) n=1 Tax=Deinococcus metalli TaxID=1141878 RepID=A0A7W8KGG2_9DEIO|nr:DUF305 domain-containing protein [Deinococcus metalli]MBB5377726.1 uncharacterized protein (DUF305 family) [Deinococcus metalli]GHF52872.1 hypothetical protein GCM10017781_31550 [Deinococcus metalli]